jgi:hypothetical protein
MKAAMAIKAIKALRLSIPREWNEVKRISVMDGPTKNGDIFLILHVTAYSDSGGFLGIRLVSPWLKTKKIKDRNKNSNRILLKVIKGKKFSADTIYSIT